MEIVEMTSGHIPAAISLWEQTENIGLHDDVDSPQAIGRHLERNAGMSFVATEDGNLVAAILCGTDGRRGYLHHLAVAPPHRRQGIGSAIVARALATLKKADIRKCHLFLFRTNETGQRFWTKIGWSVREDITIVSKVY